MNALSDLTSTFGARAADSKTAAGGPEAMLADTEVSPAQEAAAPADDEIVLEQLEQDLAEGLEQELRAGGAKGEEAQGEKSARLLEVRRKRGVAAEMGGRIRDGASMLSGLSRQADLLTAYLEKAERELERLDVTEARAEKLTRLNEMLVTGGREMRATLTDQKKKLALYEVKMKALRESNEAAKTRVARLLEEQRHTGVEMSTLQAKMARTYDERQGLAERLTAREDELADLQARYKQARDAEHKALGEARAKDEELAHRNAEIEELMRTRKQQSMEVQELTARVDTLNAETIDQQAMIDELRAELDSTRRTQEEIIRLKTNRILELEAREGIAMSGRHEIETPPMAHEPDHAEPDTPNGKEKNSKAVKSAAKPAEKSDDKTETKVAEKSAAKADAKAAK